MDKHLKWYDTHVARPVIQVFLDLCQIYQETKGRRARSRLSTSQICRKLLEYGGRRIWWIYICLKITAISSSSTTMTASVTSSSCGHWRPRQWFCGWLYDGYLLRARSTLSHANRQWAEFSNKMLMARIKKLWTSMLIAHGRPRHPED